MRIMALDCEFNQPSQTLIQIGAVIGDLKTGKIVAEFSRIIKTEELIDPRIVELTGITQEMVNDGTSLLSAYKELAEFRKQNKANKQVVTWGDGDLRQIKVQVQKVIDKPPNEWWDLGFRFYDAKTIFQAFRLANWKPTKGGLAKAMENIGLIFEGIQHNALYDAKNTFIIFYKLLCAMKDRT